MKHLNLDTTFRVDDDSIHLGFKLFTFPGGEPHIKLDEPDKLKGSEVIITHRISSFNKLGEVLVAVNALKNAQVENISLFLPCFPGSRQDRVAVPGEALTVKVYADIINAQGFKNVAILDAHSDVTPALLDNCISINNHEFVKKALEDMGEVDQPVLISPDAGANKKIKDLAKYLVGEGIKLPIVKCDKTRDVETGNITGFEIYSTDIQNKDCIIVDDLCDGGGTFLGLAKELKTKGARNVHLIVTHGIFSKGTQTLEGVFKSIHTTDSTEPHEFATVNIIKIKNI